MLMTHMPYGITEEFDIMMKCNDAALSYYVPNEMWQMGASKASKCRHIKLDRLMK